MNPRDITLSRVRSVLDDVAQGSDLIAKREAAAIARYTLGLERYGAMPDDIKQTYIDRIELLELQLRTAKSIAAKR